MTSLRLTYAPCSSRKNSNAPGETIGVYKLLLPPSFPFQGVAQVAGSRNVGITKNPVDDGTVSFRYTPLLSFYLCVYT